jgi:hypothetical protein
VIKCEVGNTIEDQKFQICHLLEAKIIKSSREVKNMEGLGKDKISGPTIVDVLSMSPQPTPELIFDLRELYKCNTDPHGNKL